MEDSARLKAVMSTASLALLMNRYAFNCRGTPLTNVKVTSEGDQLRLKAPLNKTIPVEMPTELKPIASDAVNYMYYRGGKVRFGKITIANSEIEFVDTHPKDAFSFMLPRYYDQFAAGYTKNALNGALISYAPDYRQFGERGAAPDLRSLVQNVVTPALEGTRTH